MGCYDVFCPICGICVFIPKNDLDKKYTSKIKWIEKASFMTATNEIKKTCSEISCSNVFYCAKKPHVKKSYISVLYPHRVYYDSEDNITGYFIHRDCYEFIKKKFKINIVFGDFYHSAKNKLTLNDHYVNFGGVEKYWDQYFDWNKMIEDGNFWMAESPLKNAKNAKRIVKIIKQLKIKAGRSGPTISASFFADGDIKIGNDGYFWIIKNKKWTKIPEKPVIEKIKNTIPILLREPIGKDKYWVILKNKKWTKTKKNPITKEVKNTINLMKKIPKIGFTNTKPIFIKDFDNDTITLIKAPST